MVIRSYHTLSKNIYMYLSISKTWLVKLFELANSLGVEPNYCTFKVKCAHVRFVCVNIPVVGQSITNIEKCSLICN